MKKIFLLASLALCLGFTACDDYEEPNPPAQNNPQEPVFEAGGVSFAAGEALASTVSIEEYLTLGQNIPVNTITAEGLPDGYTIGTELYLSKDDTFSAPVPLASSVENNIMYVAPQDLEEAWVNMYGKSPKEQTVYLRSAAYAVNGTTKVRIGDENTYFGPFSMNVLPVPADVTIEDMYYLVGTINGWNPAEGVSFSHSAQGVYDDPVFTVRFEITADQAADGWWWKIIPQSSYATGGWGSGDDSQFGVAENGDESLSGLLVGKKGDQEPGAGCLKEAGVYIMTINMMDQTYAFERQPDIQVLYTPGGSNGWNAGASQQLWSTDATNYTGYVYLDGEFKFADTTDWSGTNYGSTGEEGTLSTDGGAGNLTADKGLYWANVNLETLTYTLTPINTIGLIGGFNSWGESLAMTPSEDMLTWTATVTFNAGDEWKFRANDGWDINLGGSLDDLTPGGDNLVEAAGGEKTVTLYLGQRPYTATVE